MEHINNSLRKASPFRMITFSFIAAILAGAILLSLPFAVQEGKPCSFIDALFTSGSAVCVTGLVVHNTAVYWSAFGKAVILVLIQIGGLGIVTIMVMIAMVTGQRIGLWQRNLMQNSVGALKIGGIIKFVRFILIFTVIAEAIGAVLLTVGFAGRYGLPNAIFKGVFHSISAFCNAGFDLLGDRVAFSSLTDYRGDVFVNIVIMSLIVVGGLGFLTWEDLLEHRFHLKKCRLQTKIIIAASLLLIAVPAVCFFIFEFGSFGIRDRVLASLFQSVTTRTAGFNTVDFSGISEAAKLLMIVLMLIGGSPGSTAGGMKTTTFAVSFLSMIRSFHRKKQVDVFGRRIPSDVIKNALTLIMMYILALVTGTLILSRMEGLPVMDCLFECASALGTVGLTTGITPGLGSAAKVMLIIFMYFGRVGGLTFAYAALSEDRNEGGRLPKEQVMVG